MTAISDIIGGLGAAIDDLDAAQTEADGAIDHALDVKDKVLASGWSGIAEGMQEVADRLEEVLVAIGRAKDHTEQAAGHLRQVDARMSPSEVTGQLNGTISKLDQGHAAITAALEDLDEAESTVNRVLDGGDPGPLLGMISEVGQRLAGARQQLQQDRDAADIQVQESAHAGN